MRTRARQNRDYAFGTGAVIITLLALSFAVWWFRPATLDPTTLCPTSQPIAGHTVVIVDRTDEWAPAVGATLSEIIENAQRNTQRYQKFSIVSLDASNSVRPLFSVCNPGAPDLVSDLYRGRRYTQRDFDQKFVGAAERVLEEVRQPSQAPSSPIIEYMHRWLGADDFNASVPGRRMILISDMRQNSPQYSLYAHPDGAGLDEVVADQFGSSAKDATFDIYFIAHGQEHDVSEDQAKSAWDHAFASLGATHTWRQIN